MTAPPADLLATCLDGVRNGMETDVDCGGPSCPRCIPGKVCGGATDCTRSKSVTVFWYSVTPTVANCFPRVASSPVSISVLRSGVIAESPNWNGASCPT